MSDEINQVDNQNTYVKKDERGVKLTHLQLTDGRQIVLINSLSDLTEEQRQALTEIEPHILTVLNSAKNVIPKKNKKEVVKNYLGAGAFGKVVLGLEEREGRIIFHAIKKMKAQEKGAKADILEKESKLNQILHEKKIPSTIAAGTSVVRNLKETNENKYYLVLPLAAAGDGDNYINDYHSKGKPANHANNWLGITRDLTHSLIEQHKANIVNFDIKPANILLSKDSENPDKLKAAFSDFGCAHYINDKGEYISVSGQTDFHYLPADFGEMVKGGLSKNEEGLEKRKMIDKFRYGLTLLFLLDPQAEELYRKCLDQAVKASGMSLIEWHLATGNNPLDHSFTEFKMTFFNKMFDIIEQMLLDKNEINPDIIKTLLAFVKNPKDDLNKLLSLANNKFYDVSYHEQKEPTDLSVYLAEMSPVLTVNDKKESDSPSKILHTDYDEHSDYSSHASYDTAGKESKINETASAEFSLPEMQAKQNTLKMMPITEEEERSEEKEQPQKEGNQLSALYFLNKLKKHEKVDIESEEFKTFASQVNVNSVLVDKMKTMFKTAEYNDNLAKKTIYDILDLIAQKQNFKLHGLGGKRAKIPIIQKGFTLYLEKNVPLGVFKMLQLIQKAEGDGNWLDALTKIRQIAEERKDPKVASVWNRLWRDKSTFEFYEKIYSKTNDYPLFQTNEYVKEFAKSNVFNHPNKP